jgi:DNA polymerase III subunit epsilon
MVQVKGNTLQHCKTKMESTFTAIDFETAHGKRWSICQVGLVRIENGIITQELNILVQPPNNFYWDRFIDIHGITPQITANAPTFDQVWHIIEPFIIDQVIVAHNGFSFDFPVLNQTLEYYGLQVPVYEKRCTYKIYRKGLASLCQFNNIPLNHHDALSDARACAELYLSYLMKIEK